MGGQARKEKKKEKALCVSMHAFFFLRASTQTCIAGWQAGGSQDKLG